MLKDIVFASHNRHKAVEVSKILQDALQQYNLKMIAYDGPEAVETGTSFAENALIKARAAAFHTGKISVADDSGISVDVLGGCPGIFSARWAGSAKSPKSNLELLMWQLSDISEANRAAQFICAAALVTPDGFEKVVVSKWKGSIALEARGEHGFGYDPIFIPQGDSRTAAEYSEEEKNTISHRATAFKQLFIESEDIFIK